MSVFKHGITLEELNKLSLHSMVEHVSIEYTSIGEDYLEAKMPVDNRTHQTLGMLHGGASVALAETLGSVAAMCCLDTNLQYGVGLEINANHIKSVREGFVIGRVKPVHIGKKTHVWEIRITTEKNELFCLSKITIT